MVVDISELVNLQDPSEIKWIEILHGQNHYFLPKTLLVKKVKWSKSDGNFIIGQERVDRWIPLPLNYKPDDLIKIPQKWNYHPQEYPKHLRSETARVLIEMLEAAEKQNIHIRVVSAFRSALDQRRLYLRKINQAGLDQLLVAKPGHSEHQLGTTVDLCGLDPDYVLKPEFRETKEGQWLQENAKSYGFIQTYTQENAKKTGYSPEPWHFRYIGRDIPD
ncbi:MAG: M15 family metallopeptidase [Candidatus Aminicenantes bacterium]|nr:M15 family metallopeptidase [Candidatus Aminicenantes bacterium]